MSNPAPENNGGIDVATTEMCGLMSKKDKQKSDSLPTLTVAQLAMLEVLFEDGTTGQVLARKADGSVEWITKA